LRSNRLDAAAMISSDRLRFCFALRGRESSASNISIRGSSVSRRRFSSFSVDRDEDRLAQRIGQERMRLLFAAAAGVSGLPPFGNGCATAGSRGPPCNRAGRPPYAASFALAIQFCRLSQRVGVVIEILVVYSGGIDNMITCDNGTF
jgi:hypothetical protein